MGSSETTASTVTTNTKTKTKMPSKNIIVVSGPSLAANRSRRGGTDKRKEDEKRKMRRNRNRLAAARCRQKRLDQIETLQVEVNNWEKKNRSLEEEVAAR